MAYGAHTWTSNEAITAEKMNALENGLASASSTAETANSKATTANTKAENAQTTANQALSQVNNQVIQQNITNGNNAWTYVKEAIGYNDQNQSIVKTLDQRFTTIEGKNASQDSLITAVTNQITNAASIGPDDSLLHALQSLDSRISINSGNIANLESAGQPYGSLLLRLNAEDSKINNLEIAVNDSRSSDKWNRKVANGNGFDSLDDRLEYDETKIANNETAIGNLGTNKINYSDVVTNLETNTSMPLAASQGRQLKQIIGGSYSTTNTVASGITAAEQNAKEYTSNRLGTGFDTTNTVRKAINDLTTAYTSADTAINGRIDSLSAEIGANATSGLQGRIKALEDEIDAANGNGTLDDRFDAIETDIGTIDGKLTAIDNGTNTMISGINNKIDTIAGELGMYSESDTTTSTRIDTIESNLGTLSSTVNDTTAGLAATKVIADAAKIKADAAATASDLSTLAGRVTTLENEPKSATTIIENVNYNNDGIPTNISNPSSDVDYLLKKDDQYYYWKYINNSWQLISGGNSESGGTSSAEFYSSLTNVPEPYSDTIDYFIGSNDNYIHYRWLNNQWVQILPDGLLNYAAVDTSQVTIGEGAETITTNKSRPIVKAVGSEANLLANFNAIQSIVATPVQGGGYTLAWTDIDGNMTDVTLTGGGGNYGNAFINRITSANLTKIINDECIIEYTYVAKNAADQLVAQTTTAQWYINRTLVATSDVRVNDPADETDKNNFNITQYLQPGTNNVSVSISITIDGQTIPRSQTWIIEVKNFSLEWNYDESTIQDGSTISFSCTPYGVDINKTLHLKIGALEQTKTVTTSAIPTSIVVTNNFSHGVHTAEMWMTATINGQSEETPHIFHDFIVVVANNTAPIIAATLPSTSINQYNTINIPFVVYTPNSSFSDVELAVNGVTVDIRPEVTRATQRWYYTPSSLGTNLIYDEEENIIGGIHTLTITSGTTVKTLTLTVNKVNINNAEIGDYTFKLKASELASNNALQSWYYGDPNTTKLQFSNNFDWINGGLKTEFDENQQIRQYIRVKTGTRMTIPYKMFSNLVDPRENGFNFKIIFKVENCRNYDAVVATNIVDNIGIQLNAHNAVFKSNTRSVSTQYGENDYTELEFEIYKSLDENNQPAKNPYIMAWIDGIITTARSNDGSFSQTNAADFVIGSDDCDVCIYLIKCYPKVLTIADHITNFIADAPNAAEMIRRYDRNDILYTDSTDIDPNKLADKNPDCRVWKYDISRMTTGKKDYVRKVAFQQIYKNGTAYQDGLHGIGTLTVQGTSSVNYRKGAANTDINFYDTKAEPGENETFADYSQLFDGENNNLLYDIVNGEQVLKPVMERGFKINTNSVPITYSNMKVNFASCEQVNNMCNAEWYQQFQPYPSLSSRDCMEFAMGVQFIHDQGINEPSGEVILFNEKGANRDPNKYYMYSIGNLGTSKKNTHIFHSENECCVEVMNNQNAGCRMISIPSDLQADYVAYQNEQYESMTNYDWGGDNKAKDHSYEMRFPDTKNPAKEIKAGWARFVKWMADNNPGAATNTALNSPETYTPYTFKGHKRQGTQVLRGTTVNQYAGTYTTDSFERRMAKMLSECEDYMAMDSVVYHFLYIERHTMVDNVAKNTFWSAEKTNQYIDGIEQADTEGYWIWDLSKNYDNDTSDGNNNEGQLIFDYGNEANDMQDGKAIFNAADAVWFIFISNLYEACQAMFQNRESAMSKNGKWQNAWNASAYHSYLLSEQRKVPERVWNECYWYDYLRTFETGKVYNEETDQDTQIIDKSWITFLDGGQKTHQRKHYETFEELYDASKYRSNYSTSNSITLRGYTPDDGDPSLAAVPAKSEISVKMYNKCYLTAHFDNNIETQKAERGQLVTLQFLEDNNYMHLSDTVIKIDTASMIQEIGDLAPLYPGQASFSPAIRLRSIKIGDSTPGYNNPHITNTETGTVDFGANYMLEHLEVQNLSNANQPLDLSGCPALTYLDASGSSFTSIIFANGGVLTEAYINNPTSLEMRNLDLLSSNNFHLTDPTAISQLRLEGCKLFNNLSFVQSLTNLNIIRLTDINWSLNNNTLLNRLLNLTGINELGYIIPQSYLAGNVELTGTVYEGDYDKYNKAWSPDLSIDCSHSQFINQHLVTYYNEDGTKLYETYINHGNNIIDPYFNNLLDEAPTKNATIEKRYTFGSTDQANNYLEYSGWRLSSDDGSIYHTYGSNPTIPVNGAMDLIAVFSETSQQYTVRWLLNSGQVVQEIQYQNYGGGYNLTAPTIKDVKAAGYSTYSFTSNGNNCTYSIMTGWEKLPTNITPTVLNAPYDIYPTWLTRENVNYNTVLTSDDYSIEEKLLILKEMSVARNSLSILDKFPVKLGYDGIKPSINLLYDSTRNPSGGPIRYIGNNSKTLNDYTPFGANKSFTIAIDYRFEHKMNSNYSEAVLLSCYHDDGNGTKQGFKLFYNPTIASPVPQISFGDTAAAGIQNILTIGPSLNERNIIVLRHIAGDSNLYIYTGSSNSGLNKNYNSNEFRKILPWSAVVTDNAKIVLGGINNEAACMNATGTLYSVRYWEEDLGEGECTQLANWCHETINFAVQDYSNYSSHSAINNTLTASLVLHALNASEMGQIEEESTRESSTIGWDPSNTRTFYNSRVYQAFPILLQSILVQMPIAHRKADYDQDSGGLIIRPSGVSTTSDYVFAPSCVETGVNDVENRYNVEAVNSFPWFSNHQMKVLHYNNGAFEENSSYNLATYTNIRFPYQYNPINSSITVYVDYPASGSSFQNWLSVNSPSTPLKTGDILIPTNSSIAYMYVGANEINAGAPLTTDTSTALTITGLGGWINSVSWTTRSVPASIGRSSNYTKFIFVEADGKLNSGRGLKQGIVYSIAL